MLKLQASKKLGFEERMDYYDEEKTCNYIYRFYADSCDGSYNLCRSGYEPDAADE